AGQLQQPGQAHDDDQLQVEGRATAPTAGRRPDPEPAAPPGRPTVRAPRPALTLAGRSHASPGFLAQSAPRCPPRPAVCDTLWGVRISVKVDYAVRAMVQLAAVASQEPVKADTIARAQDIPLNFLRGMLSDLKRPHLLRS